MKKYDYRQKQVNGFFRHVAMRFDGEEMQEILTCTNAQTLKRATRSNPGKWRFSHDFGKKFHL